MAAKKVADGRQARWDRHNQERRQRILDAAVEVLEELPPGAEFHVQQIADRAGIGRTVLYRHFVDRADLDNAVQSHIFDLIRAELLPEVSFQGKPVAIIRRIIAAYVGWAAGHPSLHRFAETLPTGAGPSQLDDALAGLARQIEDVLVFGVEVLHVELDDDTRAALDPLVFGLVGAAFAAVRRWLYRPERTPSADAMVDLVTQAIWLQIAGMASVRGVELDPDVPVESLIESLEQSGQL